MFFHKKRDLGPVPVEEVRQLNASGMSEKDIVKRLKSKGYSYDEIEKAMMTAIKRGVEENPFTQSYTPYQESQQAKRPEFPEVPELGEYKPEGQDLLAGMQELSAELDINPDTIVEEVVEGVVEEKWQKFEDKFKKLENDYVNLSVQVKQLEAAPKSEQQPKDYESKITELSDQLEDLQARVGGLEKAFRQFLPSLTKNIESLSNLIHEMKEKRGIVTQEM